VIDAVRLETHVHREPTAAGYRAIAAFTAEQRLVPQADPLLSVTLAELELR
jgi:hypothetical protein